MMSMTWPIVVESADQGYTATAVYEFPIRATAPTREAALTAVRAALAEEIRHMNPLIEAWEEQPTRLTEQLIAKVMLMKKEQSIRLQDQVKTEVVMVDIEEDPWQELAGKYADDERLREICAEAYAARDKERVS
jgi:hypothetical protein